ncbi:spore germination protein [Bacillus shivajii]|uniref:GerAB/ArcD/ProY family transporter n=1 Tax=Bacillus shivajii TaxID=1983719 RepID=UPI001CFC36A7|nr:GerAB/ArcD/ProY family transporter [Bacillus shivajii]UCZ53852.1 spore germination protein [Bacillus shivajii]
MKASEQPPVYQIGQLEISISLIAMIIGTGIIVLPRGLASEMDTPDGWLSLMISGLLVMVIVWLIVRLHQNFPGRTLIQYLAEGKVGKWVSKLLAFSFLLYFACLTAYMCRFLTIVIDIYLLINTPNEVIMMILLLLSAYAVSKGVQGIVHLNLMFTPFVTFFLFFILSFEIPELELTHLRPVLAEGFTPVFIGLKETMFAFLGIEILFFFMAYMKKPDIRAKPLLVSIVFISLIYLFIIIMAFAAFGLEATQQYTFPLIEIVKEVEIPGGIFERAAPLFVTIWVMSMFNTFTITFLLSANLVKKEFFPWVKKKKWIVAFLIFSFYIIAFLPKSFIELGTFSEWIAYSGFINIFIGIICGYLTVWYRNNKKHKNEQEVEG